MDSSASRIAFRHCWPAARQSLLPLTQSPPPSSPLTPNSTLGPPAQLRQASIHPSRASCASSCRQVHPQAGLSKAVQPATPRPKASASRLPLKSPNGTGPFLSGLFTRAGVMVCSDVDPPRSLPILTLTTSLRACRFASAFTPISQTRQVLPHPISKPALTLSSIDRLTRQSLTPTAAPI